MIQIYKDIQLRFYKILLAFLLTIDVEMGTVANIETDNLDIIYQYKRDANKKDVFDDSRFIKKSNKHNAIIVT